MHQGLLILAALYALPPSDFEGVGSRRGATDNVAVADAHRPAPSLSVRPLDDGPTDVVGTLLTLRKAPVDDVWNRIHELSARADETTSAALSDFIESEDFPSRPPTVRFAASALALG